MPSPTVLAVLAVVRVGFVRDVLSLNDPRPRSSFTTKANSNSQRSKERAKDGLYTRGHRGTPATAGVDAAIAHADSRHRAIAPLAGSQVAGSDRAGPRRATDIG